MITRTRVSMLLAALAILVSASMPMAPAQVAATGEGFAHPEWLVDAAWLQEHIAGEDLAIVALTPEDDFLAGHIPGAAQIDWPALEILDTTDASLASWQAEAQDILTQLGIERDDTVIVYDGGTFIAGRVWWVLHQLGHEDVRLLNGGLEAWVAADGEVATGESTASPASEPYVGEPVPQVLTTIDEAVAALDVGEAVFLDARRPDDEFAVGHIPGAINVPFIQNAMPEGIRFWRDAADLQALYEQAGVNPEEEIIVYCASGVRSAVTYFALLQLGYENVSVFSGSFLEWTADPERPVDTAA